MILLNFSHPLTEAQRTQIEAQTGLSIGRLIECPPQFDEQQPFGPQAEALLAGIDLTPAQWQSEPILVVPPALNFITVLVLADLHGRMGYFPPIVRIRPLAGSLPRQYETAEILDLQTIRDVARKQRA